MKLLQFCGNWDSSSLCFLCYMQKWCKIHCTLNTLSSNYSLLQFEFNLHVVFTTIMYARRCYTYCRDLCWFHLLVEFTQSLQQEVLLYSRHFSFLIYLPTSFQPIHTPCMLFRSSKWKVGWQIRLEASVSASMLEMLRQKYTVCKES